MLTAAQSQSRKELELFCLVLVLRGKGNEEIPKPLRDHFNKILTEARKIIKNPKGISPLMTPQAIKLARYLIRSDDLKKALSGVNSIDDVDKKKSQEILIGLDSV